MMYDYARPATVDDVIIRALKYLVILYGNGVNPLKEESVIITSGGGNMDKSLKTIQVKYEEKNCDICEGTKGCYVVEVIDDLLKTIDVSKTCSIVDTLIFIHQWFAPIHSVVLQYEQRFRDLYFEGNYFEGNFNALNVGHFFAAPGTKMTLLPKDF